MALPTGVAAQLGIKAESTYGTAVTVDRFYELESESIRTDVVTVRGNHLGTGRFRRSDRRKQVIRGARGPIDMIVMNKGFGLWFQHALGQNTITGDQDAKTHTCIPDTAAKSGKSLTVQVGRPDVGGTVRPFTFEGGKILEWELRCDLDGALHFVPTLDFETVATGTALASASYPSGMEYFIFSEAALTLDGSAVSASNFSMRYNDSLNAERRFLGNVKKEPLAGGIAEVTGAFQCEFEDLTRFNSWVAGDIEGALVVTYELATDIGETSTPYSLTVTIPALAYTGEEPNVGGPETVMQNVPFEALYNGSDPIVTLEYVTSDTAA